MSSDSGRPTGDKGSSGESAGRWRRAGDGARGGSSSEGGGDARGHGGAGRNERAPRRDARDGERARSTERRGPRRDDRARPNDARGPRRDGRGDQRSGRPDERRQADRERVDSGRRGPRSWDRAGSSGGDRPAGGRRDPEIPEGITGRELDRSVWREFRTLSKENAEGVAQHLVASAVLLEEDPDAALLHAQTAARRAGRVAAVREGLGLVHYRRGEFSDALREFRTARRLSGSNHLLPYMVDCERGLGRLQRALDLAASPEAKTLGEDDNIELAIVVSGVRRDLGQPDAALMLLRIPALQRAGRQPWAGRLMYAYAEALLATGDEGGAQTWFARAVEADQSQETDAAERLAELQGIVIEDLAEGEEPGDEWDVESDPPEAQPSDDVSEPGRDSAE